MRLARKSYQLSGTISDRRGRCYPWVLKERSRGGRRGAGGSRSSRFRTGAVPGKNNWCCFWRRTLSCGCGGGGAEATAAAYTMIASGELPMLEATMS